MITAQPIVRAFRGENRLLPDDQLPPEVSPDAQNVDYSSGTIRRRLGYRRMNATAIKTGGVRITNSASAKCLITRPFVPWGDLGLRVCGFEISVQFISVPTADAYIACHASTAGSVGWYLWYESTTGCFSVRTYYSRSSGGDTNTTFDSALPSGGVTAGTTYNISVTWEIGTPALKLYVNGSVETSALTNFTGILDMASYPLVIGADGSGGAAGNQTSDMIVDEVRYWPTAPSAATIALYRGIELPSTEWDEVTLYWRLNRGEASFENSIGTNNITPKIVPLVLYGIGAIPVEGIVSNQDGSDGYAFQADGIGLYAYGAGAALPATVYETGNTWTVECWARLDQPPNAVSSIISVGCSNVNNGHVIEAFIDSSYRLWLRYSTTTTHSNVTSNTTYDATRGVAFHMAITRNAGTIKLYINGALLHTVTGVTTENGPNSDASAIGYAIGARAHSTTISSYFPGTVDEVRIWSITRSAYDIALWYDRIFPDVKISGLEAYHRFDADGFLKNQCGTEALPYELTTTNWTGSPAWSYGLVNQQDVDDDGRVVLVAPMVSPRGTEITDSNILGPIYPAGAPKSREILTASEFTYYNIIGGSLRILANFKRTARDVVFSWCQFKGYVITCNGVEENRKYDGRELPQTVTIATPTATHTVTPTGSGSTWTGSAGTYTYTYAYRNSRDGTESLIGPEVTAAMLATHNTANIASLPSTCPSDSAQIDQIRIYRKDPSSTQYRYLTDVAFGTTTYNDTGTDIDENDILDLLRGHVSESRYTWVAKNRLFFANSNLYPSGVFFSEADTMQFPAVNLLQCDRDDGDEVTGGIGAFGGSVVFKERSIHFLSGEGLTTWNMAKYVTGIGCVAGNTVVQGPQGVYFLGIDGVYLLSAPNAAQMLSISQQDVFLDLDTSKKRRSCGIYDPKRHQYLVSFHTNADGHITMVYDEETQSWAKWDIGFDCFAISENVDDNETEVLGGRNGYVVRLFSSNQDGVTVGNGSETTYTGTATATSTSATLTDSGQTFPTTNDGLHGVPVLLVDSSGTVYSNTIMSNTATILYLQNTAGVSGSVTYYVGGVDFYWESPWMDMGDPSVVKQWHYIHSWLVEQGGTMSMKHKTTEQETWQTTTFTMADEFSRVALSNRGRKLKVRFQYQHPYYSAEVESFQTYFAPMGAVF